MSFLTEIECSRESLVGSIVSNIPEALKRRAVKPVKSNCSASKHFLPKQSPSPLDARDNDFYVYKRMSRMLDTEFPAKIGCDPIDALEGFRATPDVKGAVGLEGRAAPASSPSSTRAKKMLQDARAWNFKYSEALEQSQFLKNRDVKVAKSGGRASMSFELSGATTRSEIISNLKVLSEMSIQSSEDSDDTESLMYFSQLSENSSKKEKSSQLLKSDKSVCHSSPKFVRSLLSASTLSPDLVDNDAILLSNKEQKRSIMTCKMLDSQSIMQTDASDPDSDESDVELSAMKQILESAKCRPFSDIRRCDHDEINPYGNSDYLNEYQDELQRSLSRLNGKKLIEAAPKAKHVNMKRDQFKSTEKSFYDILKEEVDHPQSTSQFELKSHLMRPRQLEGNPGYEYQRYCELHSIPIQKQTALKKDSKELSFVNITMSGLPQASAVAHFLQNTADLRKLVVDSCSVRGLEFNVISNALGNLRNLSSLSLIGADFSTHDCTASSFAQLTCLTELIVQNCKLNDFDGAKMVRAIKPNTKLTNISLAQNLVGIRTCNAIAEVFCDPWIKWQDVDLSWNHIQGASPVLMLGCLGKSYTVQRIDLSWNGMRHETAIFAFCNALATSDCVKFANLSNCEISDHGALLIADLLEKTRSLIELNLLQNPIRTFGCRSILRTLGLRHKTSADLQSVKVRLPVEQKSLLESVFDVESLTGNIKLDLSLPSHRHILKAIYKRKLEGSGIIVGTMQYKGSPWNFEKILEESKKIEENVRSRAADDVERVWAGAQDPEPEPEILQAAHDVDPILFIPGQCDAEKEEFSSEDDDSADVPTEEGDEDEEFSANVTGKSNHSNPELSHNILTFTLMTIRSNSSAANIVTPFELDYYVRLIQSMDLSVPGSALRQYDVIRLLFSGSNVIKTADIIKVLNTVCDDYKMLATKLSLTRCLEKSGMEQILENLSHTEYKSLSKLVSDSIMKFTPNNPTGRYSLRLSEQLDRDFFFRLIDVKTMQDEILKSDILWQSYRYNNMERNFLNTSLDGRPIIIDRSLAVPLNGNLTFDFVSHIPPGPDQGTGVTEKHILEFVIGPQDEDEKLVLFRKWSNVSVFTVQQAVRMLSVFSGDENRVEFCVIVFNRLIDWHGRPRLFHLLSTSAMIMLISRIGYQNLWDDVTAVQYHEYDLSIAAERFCVGRLVDLAVVEPGENMCYEHLNEREFQCPASWSNDDVPKKGLFSVYYCRSDRVIAGIISRCPVHSIPPNFLQLQPSGQEWVELHKRNRLRRIIREKFPDPARAFLVMDESGDGSLSRKEFARGLRILGIELKAHELANLIELLDEDGGGEIDAEEFVAFVNAND